MMAACHEPTGSCCADPPRAHACPADPAIQYGAYADYAYNNKLIGKLVRGWGLAAVLCIWCMHA